MRPLLKSANERLQDDLFIAALYTTYLPCWDGKQLDESNMHRSKAAKRNTDVVRSILKRHWVQLDHAHHKAFAQHTLQDFGWYSRPVMQASARARCIRQATSQATPQKGLYNFPLLLRPSRRRSGRRRAASKINSCQGHIEHKAWKRPRSAGLIEQHFRSCQLQCRMMLSNGLTLI